MPHISINPAVLYWGTPVLIISSLNPDGTTNIAPMSSAFWLGHRCMLGLASISQTPQNIIRTGQCVLNLPTSSMGASINALAKTTGAKDVPEVKAAMGYQYMSAAEKWAAAGFIPQDSDLVAPTRVKECPVQMECEFVRVHHMIQDLGAPLGELAWAVEVKVVRVHVEEYLRVEGSENRVDPDRWRPMIMNFQNLYGLEGRKIESRLAEIEEESYRGLTGQIAGEFDTKENGSMGEELKT